MTCTYSERFTKRTEVEHICEQWNQGKESFNLSSSGTTGSPKFISLDRELLLWSAKGTAAKLNLKDENMFCCLPIEKAGGFMQIIRALVHDWDIYFEEPHSNPFQFLPQQHHYTLVSLSPQQIYYALANTAEQLSRFKTVLIGGAAIPPHLEAALVNFGKSYSNCRMYVTYGMTETASHIALKRVGAKRFDVLDGVDVHLEDEKLAIDIPELDHSILTHDRAKIDGDGLIILGRTDDIINSGGLKIDPLPIEHIIADILAQMGIHRNFFIGAKEDPILGQAVVLMMEGEEIKDAAFILEHLKRQLPAHHCPKQIYFNITMKYTNTGKLIRKLQID